MCIELAVKNKEQDWREQLMIVGDTSTGNFQTQIKVFLKEEFKNHKDDDLCSFNHAASDYEKKFMSDNETKIVSSILDKNEKRGKKPPLTAFVDI